jgi:signal transduction histidine kinase
MITKTDSMKKLQKIISLKPKTLVTYILKIALFALVYHLAARLGLKMAYVQVNTSPVWPPTGIGFAVLLLYGIRLWPGIAIGVLIGSLLNGAPILLALGMALGNTLESVVGVYALQKLFNFHNSMERIQDVAGLGVVALFSTTISASIGALTLSLLGETEWIYFGNIWITWWIGDLLGALVVAPVLLVWLSPSQEKLRKKSYLEGFLLLTLISLISWYVFSYEFPAGVLHQALIYVIFPFIIIGSLRLKQRGATIFIALVSGIAILGTTNNLGPFSTGSLNDSLVLLQTFTGVLALTSLVLAATTSERQKAVLALSQRVDDLATLNESSRKLLDNFYNGSTYRTICEMAVTRLGLDVAWIEPINIGIGEEARETVYGIPFSAINDARSYWEQNTTSEDMENVYFRTIDEIPPPSIEQMEYKSFATFPLVFSGEKIGTIKLLSKDKDFFSPERLQLTQSYVNLAAVAIQNSWLYSQVQQRNKQLHALSQRLLKAQEEERLNLSRELHDESGQLLAALSVQLGLLEKDSDKNNLIIQRVVELQKTANDLQENLHKLAVDLRPASLDHLGLVNALQQLTEEFSKQHNIVVEFETVRMENVRLPIEIETTLFRIVQEALTNIGLHSEASQVDVLISRNNKQVVVIVEDNGIGFTLPTTSSEQHLGLFGMRERIEMLGGEFTVESKLGEGTTVKAEVLCDD